MSWFGGGKSNSSESKSTYQEPVSDFSASSMPSSSTDYSSSGFDAQSSANALQEKMLAQQLILKLTNIAFEQCVTKPSNRLSSSEEACASAVAVKYVESVQQIMMKFSSQQ